MKCFQVQRRISGHFGSDIQYHAGVFCALFLATETLGEVYVCGGGVQGQLEEENAWSRSPVRHDVIKSLLER